MRNNHKWNQSNKNIENKRVVRVEQSILLCKRKEIFSPFTSSCSLCNNHTYLLDSPSHLRFVGDPNIVDDSLKDSLCFNAVVVVFSVEETATFSCSGMGSSGPRLDDMESVCIDSVLTEVVRISFPFPGVSLLIPEGVMLAPKLEPDIERERSERERSPPPEDDSGIERREPHFRSRGVFPPLVLMAVKAELGCRLPNEERGFKLLGRDAEETDERGEGDAGIETR